MALPFYDPHAVEANTLQRFERLEFRPLEKMGGEGAGVYALYYRGDLELYREQVAGGLPIYIGSSVCVPNRLGRHSRCIDQAVNLDRADFLVRSFCLPSGMELWFEKILILLKDPLWNKAEFGGFGTNRVAWERKNKNPSKWDIIHPGRTRCKGMNLPPEAEAELAAWWALEKTSERTLPFWE